MLKKNQLTWANVKHYIVGNYYMLYFKYIKGKELKEELKSWTDDKEAINNFNDADRFSQVIQRYSEVKQNSPECLLNGECKHCGCKMPDMLFSDKVCEGKCYKPFK